MINRRIRFRWNDGSAWRPSSAAGGIPTGKTLLANGTSQSGGYHYFLDAGARQLQYFIRHQGVGISRSLQIFRARNSLISRCRGTVDTFRVVACT